MNDTHYNEVRLLWDSDTRGRLSYTSMTISSTNKMLNQAMGINNPIQFILRMSYLKYYPTPVSLRRLVERFIRT